MTRLDKRRRVVVEVSEEVHRELRKLALLNDLKIYELTDALLEDCLRDEDRVNALVKKLNCR
jgi:hypothetical protein